MTVKETFEAARKRETSLDKSALLTLCRRLTDAVIADKADDAQGEDIYGILRELETLRTPDNFSTLEKCLGQLAYEVCQVTDDLRDTRNAEGYVVFYTDADRKTVGLALPHWGGVVQASESWAWGCRPSKSGTPAQS